MIERKAEKEAGRRAPGGTACPNIKKIERMIFMKKRIAVLLGALLTVSALTAGCGKGDAAAGTGTVENIKTGIGVITSISNSKDAGAGEAGAAAADLTIAAVTLDENGKIVDCAIDAVQTQVEFDETGALVTDLNTQFPSKQELGEAYSMKAKSAIGKEWNEQADVFADYCVGKTADEVAGIAVTEEGVASDTDLAASCTIHIGGLQAAVVKAVDNAK